MRRGLKGTRRAINKILFCSNFYQGQYGTDWHYADSFEVLGYKIKRISEQEAIGWKDWNYDLFIYMGGESPLSKKEIPIRSCYITLDLEIGLIRSFYILRANQWKYDFVFSPDGGNDEEFKRRGINHFWLKAGIWHRNCIRGNFKKEYAHDIVFVGQENYLAEWGYRKKLIDFLRKEYKDKFELYPKEKLIWGRELADLYTSTKIVIGDSINSPYYWSNRIYETLGRGGFLIHPEIKGLEKEFEYGIDFVPYKYGDFAGLKRKIDYYLSHSEERKKISDSGFKKCKKYTFLERAKEVIKICEN